MPYIVMGTVPTASVFNGSYIISGLVADKQRKVKETLRLMSLNRVAYGVSIFIFQSVFALIKGAILSWGFYNDACYWPVDTHEVSIKALLVVILLYFAQITFCMALSTIFSNS